MADDVTVTDNTEASRFEAHIDGELAGLVDYRLSGSSIDFRHTEVDPAYEGRGVAGALTRGALDAVRERGGLTVVPTCPYTKSWIDKHPDYQSLTR